MSILNASPVRGTCLKVGHGQYNKGWQSALKALSKFNRPYETKNPWLFPLHQLYLSTDRPQLLEKKLIIYIVQE